MRPDEDGFVPFDGSAAGGDPDLAALSDRLAQAGDRARAAERAPSADFAATLRARLVGAVDATGPTLVPSSIWIAPPVDDRTGPTAERFRTQAVAPRISVRPPTVLPAPRWTALLVAAVVIVSVIGLDLGHLFVAPPTTRVGDVSGATLVRDGTSSPLTTGTALQEGDVIRTGARGYATLELDGGIARLAGATSVRLTTLEHAAVSLDQLGGRVYHRVTGIDVTYRVTTAEVAWTADGTAFDVTREPDPAGGERARVVGVEHSIAIAGSDLRATLDEGDVALIHLGDAPDAAMEVSIGPAGPTDLADPWLLANARRDVALGFEPGMFRELLAAIDPEPTPTATEPSAEPVEPSSQPTEVIGPDPTTAESAAPTARPTAAPTPRPTAKPTAKPTPSPTPEPTPKPTPTMGSLSLTATACPGGFTHLAWSKAPADGFHHYQTLTSPTGTVPPVYPPVAPVTAPDGLYGTDRSWLSAIDAGLVVGDAVSYRTVAFTAGDDAIAKSPVRTVRGKAVANLGDLFVTADGGVAFDWTPFGGPGACFTWNKIVVSTTDATPSYFDGATQVWVGENQATSHALIDALDPGTYHIRLQVLRASESGSLLVAETDPTTFVVP